MVGIQNHDPPPRQTTEPETQGSHSVEATQPPSVKRLDGEVTRGEERPIAGGMYCDVWIGYWKKSSGEETGAGRVYANEADGEKTETEKVSSTLLLPFCRRNSFQVALKVLRMQKSPEKMLKVCSLSILPRISLSPPYSSRNLNVSSQNGQSWVIRTFCRFMVCVSWTFLKKRFPMVG